MSLDLPRYLSRLRQENFYNTNEGVALSQRTLHDDQAQAEQQQAPPSAEGRHSQYYTHGHLYDDR